MVTCRKAVLNAQGADQYSSILIEVTFLARTDSLDTLDILQYNTSRYYLELDRFMLCNTIDHQSAITLCVAGISPSTAAEGSVNRIMLTISLEESLR